MKTNKCHFCHQEFDQNSLEVHIARIHQNVDKLHKCEICEKVFKTQNMLKKHFSTVHDDKGFSQLILKKCNILRCYA